MGKYGTGRVYQRGRVWWLQYSRDGQKIRESSESEDRRYALALLTVRLGERKSGKLPGGLAERITLEELAQVVLAEYQANERKSLRHVRHNLKHLLSYFGKSTPAVAITKDRLVQFCADMQTKGFKNATCNVRMAALQRGYSLLVDAKRMSHDQVPVFPYLKMRNTRTGFFERAEAEAIFAHLPPAVRPALEVAYLTGWRLRSEILTRQWRHVDFNAGWLRLDAHEAKNDEGREFPLIPELLRVLEAQRERVTAIEQGLGRIIPWVFCRDTGKPIKTVQVEWKAACQAAGIPMTIEQTPDVVRTSIKWKKTWKATGRREIPGRIPHDFRRGAVRNLELAGVPRSVAMKLVGHKTEAMYRRYAITEAKSLAIGGERLSEYLETQKGMRPKVAALKTGTEQAQRRGGRSNGGA